MGVTYVQAYSMKMRRKGTNSLNLSLQHKILSYMFLPKHPTPIGKWIHFWPGYKPSLRKHGMLVLTYLVMDRQLGSKETMQINKG